MKRKERQKTRLNKQTKQKEETTKNEVPSRVYDVKIPRKERWEKRERERNNPTSTLKCWPSFVSYFHSYSVHASRGNQRLHITWIVLIRHLKWWLHWMLLRPFILLLPFGQHLFNVRSQIPILGILALNPFFLRQVWLCDLQLKGSNRSKSSTIILLRWKPSNCFCNFRIMPLVQQIIIVQAVSIEEGDAVIPFTKRSPLYYSVNNQTSASQWSIKTRQQQRWYLLSMSFLMFWVTW